MRPTPRSDSSSARVVPPLALLLLAAGAACAGERRDETLPVATVAGKWIQVHPARGALDTLEFRADGRVVGSTAGLDSTFHPLERWRIGADLMPGGLCIGEEKPRPTAPKPLLSCQGYLVSGDTLWLANRSRTTFLRVPADGRVVARAAWTSPRGDAAAPAPGDSVRVRPPRAGTQ